MEHLVTTGKIDWKRSRGRQRETWLALPAGYREIDQVSVSEWWINAMSTTETKLWSTCMLVAYGSVKSGDAWSLTSIGMASNDGDTRAGADPEGVVGGGGGGGTHTGGGRGGAQWFWVYLIGHFLRGLGGTWPLAPPLGSVPAGVCRITDLLYPDQARISRGSGGRPFNRQGFIFSIK